ncbi:hypothetical protein HDU87_002829 [Geranomyces variabilis]|uniref:PPM-type phosphatase domain-containing protein n=1 Tax=Geranomyces variabilis TaxID=109894 RepID=A0AAD5TNB0_9FUNG|nr:hypothetical protein HDU87_002829 [Geranomyces variabilis]
MPTLTISAGHSSDIGRRASQQDDCLCLSPVFPPPQHPQPQPTSPTPPPPSSSSPAASSSSFPTSHLFLILDGHGSDGGKVALHAKLILSQHIAAVGYPAIAADPVAAMKTAFTAAHCAVVENEAIDSYMAGTTAGLALVVGDTLVVAHVGDSRIVIGRERAGGEIALESLTVDHNCDNPTELARVTASPGARVDRLAMGSEGKADGPLRIFKGTLPYPGLVVTRALGDTVASRLGILTEPDVAVIKLESSDKFLVMGTDGVWDGVSDADVLSCIRAHYPRAPEEASKAITAASLAGLDRLNLDDNTTNVVVFFNWEE